MKYVTSFCIILFVLSCNKEEPDTISPQVIGMSPENLSIAIPIDAQILVQFSERIDSTSLFENFVLMVEDSIIKGVIEYDDKDFGAIFSPFGNLENAKTYKVMLGDGIIDLSGNPIEETEWEFTTIESDSATYELIFNATWSNQTHQVEFPSNAHFSGLIGMSHNENTTLYVVGELASIGIKNMAETGSKSSMIDEINSKISIGEALFLISGGGINPSPGNVSTELLVKQNHSFVSVTSMIAPSPDWFIAIGLENLLKDGFWIDSLTVESSVYDSGTDSGTNFASANSITNPPENIFKIDSPPLAVDGKVASMGTFTFIRKE